MPARPIRAGVTLHTVPTIDPKTIGQTVPQVTTPLPVVEVTQENQRPITAWPKKSYAVWDWFGVFDRLDGPRLLPRHFDALVLCLMSWQAGKDTATTLDDWQNFLPGITLNRRRVGVSTVLKWDEWTLSDKTVLAFNTQEDTYALYFNGASDMVSRTGYNADWRFWRAYVQHLEDLKTNLTAQYLPVNASNPRNLVLTGYGLGGLFAAWNAYDLNRSVVSTERSAKRVIGAVSFGAPAGWVDKTFTEQFNAFHRHLRYMTNGETFDSLNQGLRVDANGTSVSAYAANPAPLHYDDYARVILQPPDALSRRQQRYKQFKNDITSLSALDLIPVLKEWRDARSEAAYAADLVQLCKEREDTPIIDFDNALELITKIANAPAYL